MELDAFLAVVDGDASEQSLPPLLDALRRVRRGDWDGAHSIVQARADAEAAWIHALLHRQEGDTSNAAYWYRRAGRPLTDMDLNEEWMVIARALTDD